MPKLPPQDPSTEESPTPLQRKLRARRNKRRLDFRSVDGVLRESAGNYRDMRDGVVSLEAGDIYSRVISRHRELLVAQKEEQHLVDLVQQMKELNASHRGVSYDDDSDPAQLDHPYRAQRITKSDVT